MSLSLTKSKLVNLYKKENDSKVEERLSTAFVIRAREDGQIPFRVINEMHIEVILGLQIS